MATQMRRCDKIQLILARGRNKHRKNSRVLQTIRESEHFLLVEEYSY